MTFERQSASDRLLEIVDQGVALPALPAIASELMSAAHTNIDHIDMKKTADLINSDPALASRLLRVANSAFYGASGRITSVKSAMTLIGLEEVVSLINFYLLKHMMDTCPTLERFSPETFWSHSWATATAAKMLGKQQYLIQSTPGELYLGGLLHDVGKVVLAMHLEADFRQALDIAWETETPLFEVEREVIGVDHAMLAAHLLESWNLPTRILDAVSFHHEPENADEDTRELAGLIQFADFFSNQMGFGQGGSQFQCDFDQTWIVRNGVTALANPQEREVIVGQIYKTLKARDPALEEANSDEGQETPSRAAHTPRAVTRRSPTSRRQPSPGFWGGLWTTIRGALSSLF